MRFIVKGFQGAYIDKMSRHATALALILYLLISLLFIGGYQHQIFPDGISYVSIAKKYLAGDYLNAINGLWSPLIIWLLAPFIYLNIVPTLAFKILQLILGFFVVFGIRVLLDDLKISERIKLLYLLAICPTATLFAFLDQSPDFLGVCLLIYLIHFLINENYIIKKSNGLIVGLLGGFSYLAKAYNFYFFILFFIVLNFIYFIRHNKFRQIILINFSTAFLVFALISGLWIGMLSFKYDKLVVSTAGSYNLSMSGPKLAGTEIFPMFTQGFMAPVNKTAVSTWEDPTYQDMPPWSPLSSLSDFTYALHRMFVAAYTYVYDISKNPIFSFTLIYLLIISLTTRGFEIENIYYYYLFFVIYPVGYFVCHVEQRYLWINNILITVLSAYVLDSILKKIKLKKTQIYLLVFFLFSYLFVVPLYHLNFNKNNSKVVYALSTEIEKNYNFSGKKIASQYGIHQDLDWGDFLEICYYLDAKYYGITNKNTTDKKLKEQLVDFNIDYYFVRGNLRNQLDILKFEKKIGDISIYKVTNN